MRRSGDDFARRRSCRATGSGGRKSPRTFDTCDNVELEAERPQGRHCNSGGRTQFFRCGGSVRLWSEAPRDMVLRRHPVWGCGLTASGVYSRLRRCNRRHCERGYRRHCRQPCSPGRLDREAGSELDHAYREGKSSSMDLPRGFAALESHPVVSSSLECEAPLAKPTTVVYCTYGKCFG